MNAVVDEQRRTDRAVEFDGFISYSHAGDGKLAPRLQAALQRFAKPWWRRRALRVFRDESSLSANPHLWSSITDALAASNWFILLSSPEAAGSEWVDREVSWWLEHKDANRILPVLTDGVLAWDESAGRLDPRSSVPPALFGAFQEEPRWVDLRWAREDTQLDLRNSRFRSAVADIASALRDVPKDELESEEVRQHRRTLRTAWGAAALLTFLAAATTVIAFYANDQRQEALQQTEIALGNEARAESEAERAGAAEALARSRELGASAINLLDNDPELSILLGLEAIDTAPAGSEIPLEAVSALREAVHTSKIRQRIPISEGTGLVQLALAPDRSALAVMIEADAVVRLYDVETWDVVWEYTDPETVDNFQSLAFSPSGNELALGVMDSTSFHVISSRADTADTDDTLGARVVILDAATGSVSEVLDFGPCPSVEVGAYSPDGHHLAVSAGTGAGCDDQFGELSEGWRTELLDTTTWEPTTAFPTTFLAGASWSADGSRLVITGNDGQGPQVIDVSEGSVLSTVPGGFLGEISPDGALVATYGLVGYTVQIHDAETGEAVDKLTGLADFASGLRFSADGQHLVASSQGRHGAVWDMFSGELEHFLPVASAAVDVAVNDSTQEVYLATETELSVWDISGAAEGEFDSTSTGFWMQANAMATQGDFGAVIAMDLAGSAQPTVWPFDARTGRLGPERQYTYQGMAPAVLPDGRVVFAGVRGVEGDPDFARGGTLVWNPADGSMEHLLGCWVSIAAYGLTPLSDAPLCDDEKETWFLSDTTFVDPTGTTLLVSGSRNEVQLGVGGFKELHLFDAESLEPEGTFELPDPYEAVVAYGGDWVVASETEVVFTGGAEDLAVIDLETGDSLLTLLGLEVEVSKDGGLLAVVSNSGGISLYDTDTWEERVSFDAGEARVRGLEFSPDGSKLMTAATDDFVRVWDTTDGSELARIPLAGGSDGHWLDESHIVVGTSEGLWTTLTLDVDELRQLAESRLTRGFTVEECADYLIEPCSTQ